MKRITLRDIEAAKSPKGGFTRKSVEALGAQWPLTKGWKERLLGTAISEDALPKRAPVVKKKTKTKNGIKCFGTTKRNSNWEGTPTPEDCPPWN